jgi:hypothetical protein
MVGYFVTVGIVVRSDDKCETAVKWNDGDG